MQNKKSIVIGISGASGSILGVEVLRALREFSDVETHLVISKLASQTILHETKLSVAAIQKMADFHYPIHNLAATIASGSYNFIGMVIVPCSMKTLAGVASGYSDNLMLRAADVCLKEGRKLVLVPRETPLNGIHLRNLSFLHDQGVVILPAMMTFYNHPQSIQDMVDYLVGKILSQFNLLYSKYKAWDGTLDFKPNESDVI
jgi:polyprenyl P-hydroxybenzoate/phenylacrylic acid decarboxylase-like protein